LFGALVLAILAGLSLAARLAEGPDYLDAQRSKLASMQGAQLAIVGPSVADKLAAQKMCLEGGKFVGAGLDTFEAAAIAEHAVERGDIPPVWIYGVVHSFELRDNGGQASLGSDRRVATYRTLQSRGDWRLIGEDWKTALRSMAMPNLGYRDWRRGIGTLKARLSGRKQPWQVPNDEPEIMPDAASYKEDAERWASVRSGEFDRLRYYDSSIPDRAKQSLLNTHQLLQENGAQLVVVYMPLAPALREVFARDLSREMAASRLFQQQLKKAGIIVIDGTADPRIANDNANFKNASHLNDAGGALYSRLLAQQLAQLGLIAPPDCSPAISAR